MKKSKDFWLDNQGLFLIKVSKNGSSISTESKCPPLYPPATTKMVIPLKVILAQPWLHLPLFKQGPSFIWNELRGNGPNFLWG